MCLSLVSLRMPQINISISSLYVIFCDAFHWIGVSRGPYRPIVIVGVLGTGFWGDHSAPVKACQAIERAARTESKLMVCEETKMGIDALGIIHAELLFVWFCLLSCINSKYQSSSSGVQLNQHTKTKPQSILLKLFRWFGILCEIECAIESTRVLLVATYWRGSAYRHMFRNTLVAGSLGVLGKADGRFCCPPCRGWVLRKLKTSTVSGCMYQVYPDMNFPHLLAIFQVWYIMPCRKSQTFGTVFSVTRQVLGMSSLWPRIWLLLIKRSRTWGSTVSSWIS